MPRWSVRAKLLAFACIVLAPVVIASYFTAQNYVAATRAQVLSSSSATAGVAVASVDDFLSTAERLLRILSMSQELQADDRLGTTNLFTNVLSLSPEYLSLYVLDGSDQVLVKVPPMPLSDTQMRYGIEALRNGQTSISGRLGSPEQLTSALAVPLRRRGTLAGALGVEFALDRLQRNLADSVMHEHAVVLLLDGTGRVLVAPESRYFSDALDWSAVPIVQAALRGEQGAAEYRNPVDGSTWLGAYAPVRRAKWAVLVSYPNGEIFAPVQMASLATVLSLGGVVVLAMVLAVALAARFTRPLQQVKSAAQSIAQGEYDQRVPADSLPDDEIGQLARAFNRMAESLNQHMLALMSAQREIEQKASDLQQLLDRSVTVQESERKRIAQEIHDGITQTLVGSIYEIQAAKQALAGSGDRASVTQKLNSALALVSGSVSEIRRVIFDLHPTILDELGLVAALQHLARNGNDGSLHCTVHVEGPPARLSTAQELAVYRIAQEALNNVRRHAQAHQARLYLHFARDETTLIVSDDGQGFEAARGHNGHAYEHLGLIGMKERAQSVGGHLEVMSESETGTSIKLTIPRMAAPAA